MNVIDLDLCVCLHFVRLLFKGGVEDSIVTASCVIGMLIFFIAQGLAATLTLVVEDSNFTASCGIWYVSNFYSSMLCSRV